MVGQKIGKLHDNQKELCERVLILTNEWMKSGCAE